jgi:Ring finger domain
MVTHTKEDYTEVCSIDSNSDVASSSSNYCSICLETEPSDKRYIKFPCEHIFHVCCFEVYVDYNISHKPDNENISCPICRKDISTDTLKNVFNVSHENHNQNITLLVHTDISEDGNTQRLQIELIAIFVFLFFIFLTLFLTFIYNT